MACYIEWFLILGLIFILRTLYKCNESLPASADMSISVGLWVIAFTCIVGGVSLAKHFDPVSTHQQQRLRSQEDRIKQLEAGVAYFLDLLDEIETQPYKIDQLKTVIKNKVNKLREEAETEVDLMVDDLDGPKIPSDQLKATIESEIKMIRDEEKEYKKCQEEAESEL
jgi:hypothetical protein